MRADRSAGGWLALGAVALFALYVVTRSRAHTWDAIAYVARVTDDPLLSEKYLSTRMFHPHHLLFVPLGKLAHALLAPFGLAGDPFLPLQLTSAAAGAGTAWLLASMIARRTGSVPRAAIAVLGASLSHSFWAFSCEVEVMMPAIFFGTLAAWLLTRGCVVRAGLAAGVAALLHQIVTLPVATTSAVLLVTAARGGHRVRAGWIFGGVACATAALSYLWVAVWHEGLRTTAEISTWIFAAESRSAFSSHSLGTTLERALRGLGGSILAVFENAPRSLEGAPIAIAGTVSLLALGLVALAGTRNWLSAARRCDPVAVGIPVAVVLLGAFIAWFQPENQEYWVYLGPLLWAGGAVFLSSRPPKRRIALAGVLLLIALVGASNFVRTIQPAQDPENATYARFLRLAEKHFVAGDVLVAPVSTLKRGRIALPFFCGVEILEVPESEGSPTPDVQEDLSRRIDEAMRGERRLFVRQGACNVVLSFAPKGTRFNRIHGQGQYRYFSLHLPAPKQR